MPDFDDVTQVADSVLLEPPLQACELAIPGARSFAEPTRSITDGARLHLIMHGTPRPLSREHLSVGEHPQVFHQTLPRHVEVVSEL